ncbi:hypothetical protein CONLIGDRAFT_713412 [Coniochaeta ligniaria NRRL 30616]|uniref:Uncharacterized protein n=1 Tax=Coniochaeta ligniaria NRRL 30616 TaxID=1408157 RepID=A0A1J7IUM9_9PEZI|nr:hypothetical protein CONLIGDRAFT_713412 [Coniochaeta ligniaria NRRL 30616]
MAVLDWTKLQDVLDAALEADVLAIKQAPKWRAAALWADFDLSGRVEHAISMAYCIFAENGQNQQLLNHTQQMPKATPLNEKQFAHVFRYGNAVSKTKSHRTSKHVKELEVIIVRAQMEASRIASRVRLPLFVGAGISLGIGIAEMGPGYGRTAMAADREF